MNVYQISIGQSNPDQGNITGFSRDEFLKIFVAQLRHQNPMNPNQYDSNEMIAQLTGFSMLEQLYNLGSSMEALLGLTLASSMANLVGKTVQYQDEEGNLVSGRVDSVSFNGPDVVVNVDGNEVDPGQIKLISNDKGDDNA